jgi:hypothetical protein
MQSYSGTSYLARANEDCEHRDVLWHQSLYDSPFLLIRKSFSLSLNVCSHNPQRFSLQLHTIAFRDAPTLLI